MWEMFKVYIFNEVFRPVKIVKKMQFMKHIFFKILELNFILRCPCYSVIIHLSTE